MFVNACAKSGEVSGLVRLGANNPRALGLDYPEVWGVYVGMGCVSAESPLEWRGILAHAHNDPEDEWYGWLCFDKPSRVLTKTNKPTLVLLHEIAHLRCPNQHHTKKWRQTLTLMGGGREAAKYERKQGEKKPSQADCGIAPVTTEPSIETKEGEDAYSEVPSGVPIVELPKLPEMWQGGS